MTNQPLLDFKISKVDVLAVLRGRQKSHYALENRIKTSFFVLYLILMELVPRDQENVTNYIRP